MANLRQEIPKIKKTFDKKSESSNQNSKNEKCSESSISDENLSSKKPLTVQISSSDYESKQEIESEIIEEI